MKVLVLAAMEKEISLLKNILNELKEEFIENEKIYKGNIGSHEVYLAKCGIGKVNSALKTQNFINNLKPEIVINSGVAGGAGVKIGTLLVPSKIAYHDVWCGPGTPYGEANGFPLFFEPTEKIKGIIEKLKKKQGLETGLLCSGDKFISTKQEIDFIKEKFPEVKAVDMESASIVQTCYMNNVPFIVIRVVSDTPGEGENINQYENFWSEAPLKTFEAVSSMIKSL